jgi:hypothetical protein
MNPGGGGGIPPYPQDSLEALLSENRSVNKCFGSRATWDHFKLVLNPGPDGKFIFKVRKLLVFFLK